MNFRWKDRFLSGVIATAIVAVAGLLFLFYDIGGGLSRLSYDLLFRFRPETIPDDAVLVYMDPESHYALKQPFDRPWDRSLHAKLLDRLKVASTKAVAFDIFFDTPTTNDAALVAAIKNHGKVVLGAELTVIAIRGGVVYQPAPPLEELCAVAPWGVAEDTDLDDVVRKHFSGGHSTNVVSLAWRAAQLAGTQPMPDPQVERWISYYGGPGTIPAVSYVSVLSNSVPPEALSNKVVFIGARVGPGYSGGKRTDEYVTPRSGRAGAKAAGVEIVATAALNLMHGDWLEELSPMTEFLLVLGAAVLSGMLLPLVNPLRASVLAVLAIMALYGIAWYVAWQHHVWFPWAIIAFVQIPTAAICAIVYRAHELFRETQRLETALAGREVAVANTPAPVHVAPTAPIHTPWPIPASSPPANGFGPLNDQAAPPPVISDCTLLRRIGAGAYGEVWLGRTVLGAYRAVKIVYRSNFEDERPYEREFDGIKYFDPISRNHPGLVHLLHVGRNDAHGCFHYLMELADDATEKKPLEVDTYEAKTLSKVLRRRGRLPLDECIQLALALTDALKYLHSQGLIHRDIKPANIIIVGGVPKLADIGLVTQIGEGRSFVGTKCFCPPEGPGTPAGDVFSLGRVLYEACTGLRCENFPELPTNLAGRGSDAKRFHRFNKIFVKASELNPRRRYTDAVEMYKDLKALAEPAPSRWRFHLASQKT